MAQNYAKGLPVGNNGSEFQMSPPPFVALASRTVENGTVSSILTLSHDTTAIEVGTVGAPAFIKFLTQAVVDSSVAGTSVIAVAGTANFDFMVPSASVKRFILPIALINNAQGYSSQVGANIANGLYRNVAIKTAGIASVLTTEY